MSVYDKFTKKYGNKGLLPPPPEEEGDFGEDLAGFSLKRSTPPKIKQPTEKEMLEWEEWLRNMQLNREMQQELPNPAGLSGRDDETIPPPKKGSLDKLLQKYAQVMLPPAMEKSIKMPPMPMARVPDTEAIEEAHRKKVEEIEKAKEEGPEAEALKKEHLDEMLRALDEGEFFNLASHSVEKLLKLCTHYLNLCLKK